MRAKVLATVILAVAMAGLTVPLAAQTVERLYSLTMYPVLQRALTPLSSGVPFALLDALILGAVFFVLWLSARRLRTARRHRDLVPVGRLVVELVVVGALVYVVFLGLWGLNYRRVPMTTRLALVDEPIQPDAVFELGREAVGQLNAQYTRAHEIGWTDALQLPGGSLATAATSVYRDLTGTQAAVPSRLKRSMLGPYFRWTSIDGMINPFGLEVIENPDLLPFERPFVAAHEWAHLAGFADESEASFVGYLTCMRASLPAQYSGWLYLYWQVAAELRRDERARLWEALAAGPRADVEAITDRLRRGALPRLRVASWFVYDRYLKANRVEAGMRSYGAVVTLLVRAQFDSGWRPRLAGVAQPPVSRPSS